MKRLYFLRHAKSDWKNADFSDHDRPLNKRGRRACIKMAQVFENLGVSPDIVLCSTAERTRETAKRIMKTGAFNWNIQYEKALYGASADTILSQIRALPDAYQSVLIIGHNPGIEYVVTGLARDESTDGMLARISRKYPTGALACLEFETNAFSDISVHSGTLNHFVKPKDKPKI